ncbi:MAG: hypothetical protein AXA67_02040 [Methylothermaceae bacteria B42]|nr:MAG: hypothetical protein AXA67_02040 [Methylothermaceae bacteria B42]HHJ37891.1 chemotaxis protein CheW [Methylothermaceae bacterium]
MSGISEGAEFMTQANSPLDQYFESLLSPNASNASQPKAEEIEVAPQQEEKILEETPPPVVLPEGCPAWVAGQFAIQPFGLGGLQFALPEFQVNAVIPWPQVIPQPEQPAWALGEFVLEERKVWVVDTLKLILPAGKQPVPAYQMLLVGDGMALACDSVEQMVILDPNQVKWRQERTHRPWLLGMLTTSPCALIDFEKLV